MYTLTYTITFLSHTCNIINVISQHIYELYIYAYTFIIPSHTLNIISYLFVKANFELFHHT